MGTETNPPSPGDPAGDTNRETSTQGVEPDGDRKRKPYGPAFWRTVVIIAVVILVMFVAGGLPRLNNNSQLQAAAGKERGSLPIVNVIRPIHPPLVDRISLPGNIQALVQTAISARSSGYLKQWYVDIGATVKKGQLLAVVESPETDQDVLQARAETSQAVFDMASAEGNEKVARVALTELIGVEPSPDIKIDSQKDAALPQALSVPIDALIDLAIADRQDLKAQAEEIRTANDAVRAAKAEYRPKIVLSASAAQTSVWPSVDYGKLGQASEPTWTATLGVQWRIFDGGERKNQLAVAESKRREAQDAMRAKHDDAVREVWTAYIGFCTGLRKEQAAIAVLDSASASYASSLDAYKYGVRNLVDVVTAEDRLAIARLAHVSARSQLLLEAVNLEFVTGNLLRSKPSAIQMQTQSGQKQ